MTTRLPLVLGVDGLPQQLQSGDTLSGGGGGWTQIGSTLTATSGATASFTSIPATYNDLLIEVLGVSHDSGTNQQMRIELSGDNGLNYTTAMGFTVSVAATATLYGNIFLPGYLKGAGAVLSTIANLASDRTVGSTANGPAWRIAAGINAARFSWGGSANFDATGTGQFNLWGRL